MRCHIGKTLVIENLDQSLTFISSEQNFHPRSCIAIAQNRLFIPNIQRGTLDIDVCTTIEAPTCDKNEKNVSGYFFQVNFSYVMQLHKRMLRMRNSDIP